MAVLVVGLILFSDAGEGAIQLAGLAMFIAMFGTLTLLYRREDRRGERDQ